MDDLEKEFENAIKKALTPQENKPCTHRKVKVSSYTVPEKIENNTIEIDGEKYTLPTVAKFQMITKIFKPINENFEATEMFCSECGQFLGYALRPIAKIKQQAISDKDIRVIKFTKDHNDYVVKP